MLVWPAHFKFAGLADALISSVDTIIADDGDRCESTLELYFEMLIWVIDDNVEYLTDALKAELLAAIISCCRAHLYISTIMSFLEHHLQSLTVYHSVLRELRKLSTASVPETSPMFKQWKAFVDLVNERAAFMDSFDSNEYDALRACDSLECGTIRERTAFKRCGGCLRNYYCSKTCQRADWRAGAHRELCTSRCTGSCRNRMRTRDRAFLRALVHRDYLALKPSFCSRKSSS
ncbi:hypothetical protein B0H13DRAFT_623709 [Mycena leptocephala]|nr:hypothetical protein B0H13DRAFT_623709 [Mycena leptocephala]